MKYESLLNYLGIRQQEYYYAEKKLIIIREQEFSNVEMAFVENFCVNRKLKFENIKSKLIISENE